MASQTAGAPSSASEPGHSGCIESASRAQTEDCIYRRVRLTVSPLFCSVRKVAWDVGMGVAGTRVAVGAHSASQRHTQRPTATHRAPVPAPGSRCVSRDDYIRGARRPREHCVCERGEPHRGHRGAHRHRHRGLGHRRCRTAGGEKSVHKRSRRLKRGVRRETGSAARERPCREHGSATGGGDHAARARRYIICTPCLSKAYFSHDHLTYRGQSARQTRDSIRYSYRYRL